VFDSGEAGMWLPATQSGAAYAIEISPPASVRMDAMRHQFIGGDKSIVSTRLASWTPVNVTSGTLAVPPTNPVWPMALSHSPARVPSPGSGYECFSVHDSTSR
jgi:hypothetical protein